MSNNLPVVKIYNTITDTKEDLVPYEDGKIGIYVCGPTVYDSAHLGHARSAVSFDIINRFLRKLGYDVTFVRNFTDVDDKIIKRANEQGVTSLEIAERYIKDYKEDMESLNVQTPDVEPRVTDHIKQRIEVIEKIIEQGYAYQVDSDVFFSVRKFKNYGKLSHRSLENMLEGTRIDVNEQKRDPLDFALWKSAKPDEPSWDSPWGKGRPGWHIECSVMSMEYLGNSFEIHGGGKDLIFPHHENEIAQSESATHEIFAKYWLHNGLIQINSEKMSKSLGNFFTVKNAVKRWSSEAIRFFFLSHHYNNPADFSEKVMDDTESSLERIYSTLKRANDLRVETEKVDKELEEVTEKFKTNWMNSMCDNFNTADAIGNLFDLIRSVNRSLDNNGWTKSMEHAVGEIKEISEVLGILAMSPEEYLEHKSFNLNSVDITEVEIKELIAKRAEARKNKDWSTADEVRDYLDSKGIVLEDKPDRTLWKVK